jgi:hypothetical protein
LIYVKCRYRKPDLRIAFALIIIGTAYSLAFWDYLPKQNIGTTEQRLIALLVLCLPLFLFYKSTKRMRVGLLAYTKGERLKRSVISVPDAKTLIKFNIALITKMAIDLIIE